MAGRGLSEAVPVRWPPVGLRASRWALWGQLGASQRGGTREPGGCPVALWLALPWQGTEGAQDPSQTWMLTWDSGGPSPQWSPEPRSQADIGGSACSHPSGRTWASRCHPPGWVGSPVKHVSAETPPSRPLVAAGQTSGRGGGGVSPWGPEQRCQPKAAVLQPRSGWTMWRSTRAC